MGSVGVASPMPHAGAPSSGPDGRHSHLFAPPQFQLHHHSQAAMQAVQAVAVPTPVVALPASQRTSASARAAFRPACRRPQRQRVLRAVANEAESGAWVAGWVDALAPPPLWRRLHQSLWAARLPAHPTCLPLAHCSERGLHHAQRPPTWLCARGAARGPPQGCVAGAPLGAASPPACHCTAHQPPAAQAPAPTRYPCGGQLRLRRPSAPPCMIRRAPRRPPPTGVRKEVRVAGKTVLLFWYRNQIYAIEARWGSPASQVAPGFWSLVGQGGAGWQQPGAACPYCPSRSAPSRRHPRPPQPSPRIIHPPAPQVSRRGRLQRGLHQGQVHSGLLHRWAAWGGATGEAGAVRGAPSAAREPHGPARCPILYPTLCPPAPCRPAPPCLPPGPPPRAECPGTGSLFSLKDGSIVSWYPNNPVLRMLTPPSTCRPLEIYPVHLGQDAISVDVSGGWPRGSARVCVCVCGCVGVWVTQCGGGCGAHGRLRTAQGCAWRLGVCVACIVWGTGCDSGALHRHAAPAC